MLNESSNEITLSREELIKNYKEICEKGLKLFEEKNKEYSTNNDTLKNFKDSADLTEIDIYKVLFIFMHKHYMAINHFINNKETYSGESIHSRILDTINYLIILDSMIKKDGETKNV